MEFFYAFRNLSSILAIFGAFLAMASFMVERSDKETARTLEVISGTLLFLAALLSLAINDTSIWTIIELVTGLMSVFGIKRTRAAVSFLKLKASKLFKLTEMDLS